MTDSITNFYDKRLRSGNIDEQHQEFIKETGIQLNKQSFIDNLKCEAKQRGTTLDTSYKDHHSWELENFIVN